MPGSWLDHSHRPRPRAPTEQAQMRSQSGSVSSCRFGAQAGQIQIAVDNEAVNLGAVAEEVVAHASPPGRRGLGSGTISARRSASPAALIATTCQRYTP